MAPRQYTFHFGRILITGRPYGEDKSEFFTKAVKSTALCSDKFFKYTFFEGEAINYNQEMFIFGRLVKYKPIEEEVVNESAHHLDISLIPDAVITKPEFIIHARSGIVAFRPVPNKISAMQFREKLARLIELAFDNFFVSVRVEAVNEDYKIQEEFEKFRLIRFINIDLHPSNPNSRDLWDHIDKRIQGMGAVRLEETVEGGPAGLDPQLIKKDEVYDGLLMAADGYGYARITGVVDDREVTVTTSDNPTTEKVVLDNKPENVIKQLVNAFQLVKRRNHKNEE